MIRHEFIGTKVLMEAEIFYLTQMLLLSRIERGGIENSVTYIDSVSITLPTPTVLLKTLIVLKSGLECMVMMEMQYYNIQFSNIYWLFYWIQCLSSN